MPKHKKKKLPIGWIVKKRKENLPERLEHCKYCNAGFSFDKKKNEGRCGDTALNKKEGLSVTEIRNTCPRGKYSLSQAAQ